MNKQELVSEIANLTSVSRADAEKFLNAFTDVVTKKLQEGDKVSIVGFGTFSVSQRVARTGRNPKTGEEIQIPASRAPKFKPGSVLKDAIK